MVRIRLCEESFIEPIENEDVKCPVHLCSGQEAIATGVCAALSTDDYVFGTHRSHGHYLAKGGDMNKLVAEIYGKVKGCSKGRGGSMHIIAPEKGMMGAVPIVAGTIGLAVGAALALQIRKEKKVSVSFFGDGATGEGVLFESMNFAALRCLPVLFVCENNLYSTHMPIRNCRPSSDIFQTGKPFNIVSLKVDGNDVIKVYEAAEKAVELCRKGNGPVFMECLTYRLRGHVGANDNIQGTRTDIRPIDEIEGWKKNDPVVNFKNFLLKNNILEKKVIEEINKEAKEEVEEAHLFSYNSSYPRKSELSKYVFKE
jgi:pyruvate dehydrogenase E1 component alpha subunit